MADKATLILTVTQAENGDLQVHPQTSSVSGTVPIGGSSVRITWNPLEYSYNGLTALQETKIVNEDNVASGVLILARMSTNYTIFDLSTVLLTYITGYSNSVYVEVTEVANGETYTDIDVTGVNQTWTTTSTPMTPTDEGFALQWHLHDAQPYGMQVESAWDDNLGADMQIALIELAHDSQSLRYTHEDFDSTGIAEDDWASIVAETHPCLLPGYKWNYGTNQWEVDTAPINFEHATSTTGDVVAQINGKGCVGVIPKAKARIWYQGSLGGDVESITKIINEGADVITSSTVYFNEVSSTKDAAVLYALNQAIPVCQAAMYPTPWPAAGYDDLHLEYIKGVIVVNGHGRDGTNQFPRTITTVSAPAGYVRDTPPLDSDQIYRVGKPWEGVDSDNAYGYGTGTSHASPFVAGIIALIKKKNPTWVFGDIFQALLDGCVAGAGQGTREGHPAWSPSFGWGCVHAGNSLALSLGDLRVVSPQRVRIASLFHNYSIKVEWFHTFGSNYNHTVIVRKENSPALTPTDGEIVSNAVHNTMGTTSVSGIDTPNGTWYFTVFNIGNDDSYSTVIGDTTMEALYSGYLGFDNDIITAYVTPVADFAENSPVTGTVPLTVVFNDLPSGSVHSGNRLWDFGDGNTSTGANPTHDYTAPGTYTVSYTCGNSYETDTRVKTNLVTAQYQTPTASFGQDIVSGINPLTVQFTDTSTGIVTDWAWDFGDGGTSIEQSPSHIYTVNGTYTVSLVVSNLDVSDGEIKVDLITVSAPPLTPPVASFTEDVTTGNYPLTVQFTDTSTGDIATWVWLFGEGAPSIIQNPSHTYDTAGIYSVTLTVANSESDDTLIKSNLITVTTPTPTVANFFRDGGYTAPTNEAVQFTNSSTGDALEYAWDFGDGGTSTAENPTHTYATVGDFPVTLFVIGAGGTDNITKTLTIELVATIGFVGTVGGRIAKDNINFILSDNFKDVDLTTVSASLTGNNVTTVIYDGAGCGGDTYYESIIGKMYCTGSGRVITFVFYPTTLFQAGVKFNMVIEYPGI